MEITLYRNNRDWRHIPPVVSQDEELAEEPPKHFDNSVDAPPPINTPYLHPSQRDQNGFQDAPPPIDTQYLHPNHGDQNALGSGSTVVIVVVSLAGVFMLILLLVHYCRRGPTRVRGHVEAPPIANTTQPADLIPLPAYPPVSESAVCPATLPPLNAAAPKPPDNNGKPPAPLRRTSW